MGRSAYGLLFANKAQVLAAIGQRTGKPILLPMLKGWWREHLNIFWMIGQ
jgi:hypothetical protein